MDRPGRGQVAGASRKKAQTGLPRQEVVLLGDEVSQRRDVGGVLVKAGTREAVGQGKSSESLRLDRLAPPRPTSGALVACLPELWRGSMKAKPTCQCCRHDRGPRWRDISPPFLTGCRWLGGSAGRRPRPWCAT